MTNHIDYYKLMTVDIPEGELDGIKVQRFDIEKNNIHNTMNAIRGRGTRSGTYTRLLDNGNLWMSDVDAEKRDHMEPILRIEQDKAQRVLINGLGLGMVLKAALTFDHVAHVDVVERDARVIELVGTHYQKDPRVHIHHADAYEQATKWPSGTRWDVGWSDIWGDVSADDLPDMARLNRSYGRRCRWHRCWFQQDLKYQRDQEKEYERMRENLFG